MTFNSCEDSGRTLYVEFKCTRCGRTEYHKLEEYKEVEDYGYLHNIPAPCGWREVHYSRLLCQTCYEAFCNFMNNK